MCRACQRRTSVTAGTISHRTRTAMSTWFAAIWFVTSQKNGMSAQGLQRVLGFGSYETAWAWLHKLRRAMVRPDRDRLCRDRRGRRDDGRRSQPRHVRGRHRQGPGDDRGGTQRRSPSGPGPARRRRPAGQPRPGRLGRRGDRTRLARVKTDGAPVLRRLADRGFTHQATAAYSAADQSSVLPGVHLVASLLKRWLIGTLHYRVEQQHLPYYLDEYTFRFNRAHRTQPRPAVLPAPSASREAPTHTHCTNCSDPDKAPGTTSLKRICRTGVRRRERQGVRHDGGTGRPCRDGASSGRRPRPADAAARGV